MGYAEYLVGRSEGGGPVGLGLRVRVEGLGLRVRVEGIGLGLRVEGLQLGFRSGVACARCSCRSGIRDQGLGLGLGLRLWIMA